MLNELFELNSSMETAGISRAGWHKDYKQCPKGNSFFLLVAADGTVCNLEPIKDLQTIQSIRKYEVSNGFSFPAFNIPPLLFAKSNEAKQALKKLKESLQPRNQNALDRDGLLSNVQQLYDVCEPLWTQTVKNRLCECMKSPGLRQKLGNFLEEIPDEYSAISELIKRSAKVNVDELQSRFHSLILSKLEGFPEHPNDWIETLLVSSSKNVKKVSIVLELADRSSFAYPANHTKVVEFLNGLLMRSSHAAEVGNASSDAFGWLITDDDLNTTFPSVRLPRLGDTKLRAMNKESPCQKRYDGIGSNSFPAGEKVRQAMKDSLEWLGDDNRRGKTWEDISNTCGYEKALLFVYPSTLHGDPPELAGLFAPSQSGDQKFEAAAARVLPALKGVYRGTPNAQVKIFALAKVDRARTKILISKNYRVDTLLSSAQTWSNACKNIPTITLNIGSKVAPFWIEPIAPFPAQVLKCLNVAWLQGGTRSGEVHGLSIGEGVELLLATGHSLRKIVNRSLSLVVVNAKALLIAVGHADHRADGVLKLDSGIHTNLLPCLLGLLLYKQNIMKGAYMHAAPFLVGRLLALTDVLHKEYCSHVRNGLLPSQLIGNALMSSVIENPVKGLARLRERLMIYQSWANTAQGPDFRLAKWVLSQMSKVSSELAGIDLPDRTNDADKAQILLGYLARSEAKEIEKLNDSTIDLDEEVSNVR